MARNYVVFTWIGTQVRKVGMLDKSRFFYLRYFLTSLTNFVLWEWKLWKWVSNVIPQVSIIPLQQKSVLLFIFLIHFFLFRITVLFPTFPWMLHPTRACTHTHKRMWWANVLVTFSYFYSYFCKLPKKCSTTIPIKLVPLCSSEKKGKNQSQLYFSTFSCL